MSQWPSIFSSLNCEDNLEIRITEKQTEKCRSTNQATVKKEKFFSSKWC